MNIQAGQAAIGQCPGWCAGHLPADNGGVVHISRESVLTPTAGGPAERKPFYLSLEQVGDGMPAGRFEPSEDPLTVGEMFELASTLQAAAISALMGGVR